MESSTRESNPALETDRGATGTAGSRFADPCLRPPPGATRVPPFDRGWATAAGERDAFLNYLEGGEEEAPVNWSESREELHDRARAHFVDAWTRRAILARLGPL